MELLLRDVRRNQIALLDLVPAFGLPSTGDHLCLTNKSGNATTLRVLYIARFFSTKAHEAECPVAIVEEL